MSFLCETQTNFQSFLTVLLLSLQLFFFIFFYSHFCSWLLVGMTLSLSSSLPLSFGKQSAAIMAGILAQHVPGVGIGNANWRAWSGEWSRLSLFPINVEEKQHKRLLMMLLSHSVTLSPSRSFCLSDGSTWAWALCIF